MSQRLSSWAARQFPFVLPFVLLLLAWPWAFFGLLRFSRGPLWTRLLLAASWLLATVWLFCLAPGFWGKAGVFGGSVAIVRLLWFSHPPRGAGDWVAEQERLAVAHFDGDLVTIENYRHTIYRSLEDYDVQFMERQFDLSQVASVDFLVVPFASWRGVAHVFVSFGFADGEYLAVSVEARREKREPYSPIGGLFRQYEVIYAIGDERDVVAKRAVFQNHPVHLYRLKASPAVARAMLVSMLETATELAGDPQFYHTLTNTCTSNLLVNATDLKNRPRRYDFRLVFPGYADGLGVEVGFVDAPDGLLSLREASLINGRAAAAPMGDGIAWSRAVREE